MTKLRGGKRRLRRLQRQVALLADLDLKLFHSDLEFSAKAIRINPFAVTPERPASPEVQMLLVEWLAKTYLSWETILKQELKSEPFFLEIWLDAPTLTEAQVICAKGAKIAVCKDRLSGPLDRREFPYEGDSSAAELLEAFEWKQRQEPVVVMAKEFEEVPHLYRMMEELSYSRKVNAKGEPYLLLPGRSFWAGTKA